MTDPAGRRHSLDVLADSSYDACHVFLTQAKKERRSGLPIPTPDTVFEVTAKGRVYKVLGAKLREWIAKERTQRKGPAGYMFGKVFLSVSALRNDPCQLTDRVARNAALG